MSWSKLFWKLFLVYVVLTAVGMFFLTLINTHFREAQNRQQIEVHLFLPKRRGRRFGEVPYTTYFFV